MAPQSDGDALAPDAVITQQEEVIEENKTVSPSRAAYIMSVHHFLFTAVVVLVTEYPPRRLPN